MAETLDKSMSAALAEIFSPTRPTVPEPAPARCVVCGGAAHAVWVPRLERWVQDDPAVCARRATVDDHGRYVPSCADVMRQRAAGHDPLTRRAVGEDRPWLTGEEREARAIEERLVAAGLDARRYARFRGEPLAIDLIPLIDSEDRGVYVRATRRTRQRQAPAFLEMFVRSRPQASARLVYEPDLYRRLRLAWDDASDPEALSARELQQLDLLILDGCGEFERSDWEEKALRQILEEREACLLPTVLMGSEPLFSLLRQQPYSKLASILTAWLEQIELTEES